jgi:hypothetical protein
LYVELMNELSQIEVVTEAQEVRRDVNLTNDEWLVISQCVEAYADTFRKNQSLMVTTYVTRGDLQGAVTAANRMNELLERLDHIQSKLV